MSIVYDGRISSLVLFLIISLTIIYKAYQGAHGKKFVLKRSLPAIDAIPEAIGRAIELGRPVHYTPGSERSLGGRGTQTWMGVVIGGYVTRICAKLGAKVIWSVREEHLPAVTEINKEAFMLEGQSDVEPDVRYYGAFSIGVIDTLATENCAVNILFGGFGSEFPQIAEAAAQMGIYQIGGCSNTPMVPLVVATCDYSLIGEEMFAAGAILSENSPQLGSIVAIDMIRTSFVALIILGSLLVSANVVTLIEILNM